jgi:hypothetical protein
VPKPIVIDSEGRVCVLGDGVYRAVEFVPKSSLPKGWEGSCDGPHIVHPKIKILRTLRGKRRLNRIIHEALHGDDWDKGEEAIARTADMLTALLWTLTDIQWKEDDAA